MGYPFALRVFCKGVLNMWNSYFFQLQKKYNMRISSKMPLVFRFDGKQITKNKDINLMDNYDGSFFNSLEKTARFFSEKYHCYAIFGSDEISFIVTDPNMVIYDLEPNDKTTHSQELIALFSQYFFDYFNHFDTQRKIFWHGKCFSIPENKISSYIKYRSGIIKNVMVTYFAKSNRVNNELGLNDKISMCKTLPGYNEFAKIQDGILFFGGMKLDLDEFLKNGIKVEVISDDLADQEIVMDFDDIDVEML